MGRDRRFGGQRGITMAELMVAIAVSVLIVTGSLLFLRYMVTVADTNRDKTMATLEVQYVGFWINEDVVQSQSINLGNVSADPDGFPLILEWTEPDGANREIIEYRLESMDDSDLLRLMRQRDLYHWVGEDWLHDAAQSGTTEVAKHLVEWSEVEQAGTKVCRLEYPNDFDAMRSLIITVAANADGREATSCYEVFPRVAGEWLPKDEGGSYTGPECSGEECGQ